jgi:ribonuclease Z
MARFFILGSSNAIPQADRENTYFFIENGSHSVLIDCGANAFLKLQASRTPIDAVSDLVITHFHPDHVAGLPLLLMDWWLLGRKTGLRIHGLKDALDKFRTMMALFQWDQWPNFFPVEFHELDEGAQVVLEIPQVRISSMGVKHLIPTIGLKFDINNGAKTIAYSCDSESCDHIVELARGVDILIHEAAGDEIGHSSARECGVDARRAGVKELFLIHYPGEMDEASLLGEAKAEFDGPVTLAKDMMLIE